MVGTFLRLAAVLAAWFGIVGLAVLVSWRLRVRRPPAVGWRTPHDLAAELFLSAHSARLQSRAEAERP